MKKTINWILIEGVNYKPRDYFINILCFINHTNIKTIERHHLLLSLFVYQPPFKTTSFYATAKFITTNDENNKRDNFIRIDRCAKLKTQYTENKDKASNYKLYNMKKRIKANKNVR